MYDNKAGPQGGVYVVQHATDARGVWVGEAIDCHRRNRFATRMGLQWRIVRKMPGSSKKERLDAEEKTARRMEKQGFVIYSNFGRGSQFGFRPKKDALRGHKHTPEACARMGRGMLGKRHSSVTKKKMCEGQHRAFLEGRLDKRAASIRAALQKPEVKEKLAEAARAMWKRPGFREATGAAISRAKKGITRAVSNA